MKYGYTRKWNDNSWTAEKKKKKTSHHILSKKNKLWEINKWATTTRLGFFYYYINVLEYEDFIAAATGIPERWKWTHCQRVSFLCHIRVSSVRTLCGWPFLKKSKYKFHFFFNNPYLIHTDQYIEEVIHKLYKLLHLLMDVQLVLTLYNWLLVYLL